MTRTKKPFKLITSPRKDLFSGSQMSGLCFVSPKQEALNFQIKGQHND